MVYRIDVADRAGRDLRAIFHYIQAAQSQQAARWFDGMRAMIHSLAEHPARGIRTLEDASLREVSYGRRPHAYRIIYIINEQDRIVTIVHIRHGARDRFTTP